MMAERKERRLRMHSRLLDKPEPGPQFKEAHLPNGAAIKIEEPKVRQVQHVKGEVPAVPVSAVIRDVISMVLVVLGALAVIAGAAGLWGPWAALAVTGAVLCVIGFALAS
jgi:hypothetical protein